MKTIASFSSKLLALTLALMASVSTFAYDFSDGLLCYNILTENTIAVTRQSEHIIMPCYEYLPEDLVIPSEVTLQGKRYTVVSIDQWAFHGCTMLKSVIIPTTVTTIGLSAFHDCENLADVYIPKSVTIVEGSAFAYTKWFDNLPDGEIYINNTLYRYKGTAPENTKIVVKDGTTRIAGFTFWNQSNIVSVELPQTLTVIEHSAFEECTQLNSVTIPYYVTFIGANAFAECTSLTEVICLAPTPPIAGVYANPSAKSEIFMDVDVSNATLYVRAESVEAYKTADQWKEFGQILPIQPLTDEDYFPTLWGLQQTICSGYYGEEGDEWESGLTGPSQEITMMDGKPYLQWGSWYLREENDKILVYSEIQKKDLVLYDFTLELGDTLTTLNLVTPEFLEYEGIVGIVDYPLSDYDYTYPIDTLVVTELSKETLLDGKEYTRWKFSDGTVYVEGIGSMNETFFHHIADHLPVPVSYLGSYLVCVSKNNKLLYQMDDAEMERLGVECLCDYTPTIKDNAKNGKIGGRPTPTQWYVLDIETKDMGDPRPTVLRAETFSYTLENDSIVVNGRTFYQLACQSTKDTATTKSVVGALHFSEDKGNRVYFLRDGVEYLLYDFTAEPGDTIEIFAGINNYPQDTTYTHVVADKDTTEDGACRMFLEVVFPEETTTVENAEKVWLAGLGSIDGIVHNTAKRASIARSSDTQTSIMLCAWREDSCLYTTNFPDYDTLGCVYNKDGETGVKDVTMPDTSDTQKFIRDGQLLIIHEGKTYNVMGIAIE